MRRALADLNYELSPDKLKEYVLGLAEENKGKAEHTAKALKLFIKEVVKLRDSHLAREFYDLFKIPRGKINYKPVNLTLDIVKQIFNNIQDLGAKAFFLILAETGLRTGEVLSLRIDQIDLDHTIIHISKVTGTKRAYISFLHEKTALWFRDVYLQYRDDFVNKYEDSLKKLITANPDQGIDVEAWESGQQFQSFVIFTFIITSLSNKYVGT
ncbi:site-specific integrase [Sulfolobus sp. S-194]|uniref:site-specific integrase n=1 Tax=Sulfolobus sp. S-194 TaxID=2512240 RepID=UPI00257105DD|nr:site-specific integrase [Sulfolobus sp. S-194]